MSKEYGINLGYIPLEKEQYKELKQEFIDNTDSEDLLEELLQRESGDWIYDNILGIDKEKLKDAIIYDLDKLKKEQIDVLTENLEYYNICKVLPTDNLNDLAKAEFILENWDKIKIENINL